MREAASRRARAALIVGLLLTLACILRLALVWRFPPHMDEALFGRWTVLVHESAADRFAPLGAGNDPMQVWLGSAVMHLGIEPLTALRLISLAAVLGLLPVVWWTATAIADRTTGVVATLVWVLLPFSLVYGAIGLTDPLVAGLYGAAMVLQILLARRPDVGIAIALGIVVGIALLTKESALLIVGLTPLGAVLLDWSLDGRAKRLARWLGALGLAGVIALALRQILKLSPLAAHADEARRRFFSTHGVRAFLDDPGHWIDHNWPLYRLALGGYFTVPLVIAAAIGVGVSLRRSTRLATVVLGWALFPIVAAIALADEPYVRWLFPAAAPLTVFAGIGVVEVARFAARLVARHLPTAGRPAAVVAVGLSLAAAAVWDVETLRHPVTRAYPGHDDIDYVREFSAGGPWLRIRPMLERIPGPTLVATTGIGFDYLILALRDHPIELRDAPDGLADPSAVVGLENKHVLAQGPGLLGWKLVQTLTRPRDGVPVHMLERVVRIDGQELATPADLVRRIGPVHMAAFLARHPEVRAWQQAWARSQRA